MGEFLFCFCFVLFFFSFFASEDKLWIGVSYHVNLTLLRQVEFLRHALKLLRNRCPLCGNLCLINKATHNSTSNVLIGLQLIKTSQKRAPRRKFRALQNRFCMGLYLWVFLVAKRLNKFPLYCLNALLTWIIVTSWIVFHGFLNILTRHVFNSDQWGSRKCDCTTCQMTYVTGSRDLVTPAARGLGFATLEAFAEVRISHKLVSVLLHGICNFSSFQLCEVFWSYWVVVISWSLTGSDICFLFWC